MSSKVKQKLKLHFFLRQLDVLIKQEIKHTQSLLSEEENPLLHILILIYSTTAGLQSPVPWFFFFQYSELKKKRKEKSLLNQTMVTDHFYPRTESNISLWEESNVWNHTLQARQRKLSIRGSTEIWVHITNWLFKHLYQFQITVSWGPLWNSMNIFPNLSKFPIAWWLGSWLPG